MHVYTIGYQGRTLEQIAAILDRLGADLLDIRFNPYSPNHQWQQARLTSRFGAHYRTVRALGNVNYKSGGPIQIANYADGKAVIEASLRPVVLMCACKDYAHCHRRVVAEMLCSDGFEVEEISS